MIKRTTPPTNTQKDTPRNTRTGMKYSPKILSETPTRQCPMATKYRSVSASSPFCRSPQSSCTTTTMSQTCTTDPTPITMEQTRPRQKSSSKMDWQKMSLERQTSLEICAQVWQQGRVSCLPQRRLTQRERSPTVSPETESLSTQQGISMRPQSQQDMEKTRVRKVSTFTSDASSSLFRTMSWCFCVFTSIRFYWLPPRCTYRNLFRYYM